MPRLIVGNLDCEQEYANPRAPRKLPKDVRRRISAAATLMAAFGEPGDVLWTPEPVTEERALLARERAVRLCSGPLPPGPWSDILPWGETWSVAALRNDVENTLTSDDMRSAWQHHSRPEHASDCNDRRYAFAENQRRGGLLPGARVLSSVAELEAHLLAGGHRVGRVPDTLTGSDRQPTWVLEAPFSASGRFRLRRRGAHLDAAARTRARRLFATFQQLVFQPWVERLVDVGCVGIITGPQNWTRLGKHVLDSDEAGVFRGISLPDDDQPVTSPTREALAAVAQLAPDIAARLARDGYRGPFGIDGFAYRTVTGAIGLYPMCEINARMSFGVIARQLQEQHGAAGLRLHVAVGALPTDTPGVVPLLAPGSDDPTCAWLQLRTES